MSGFDTGFDTPTDDALDVEMSFLDSYRSSGAQAVRQAEAEMREQVGEQTLQRGGTSGSTSTGSSTSASAGSATTAGNASAAHQTTQVAEDAARAAETAVDTLGTSTPATGPHRPAEASSAHTEARPGEPVSLQKSDHQDAVQQLTGAGGSASSAGSAGSAGSSGQSDRRATSVPPSLSKSPFRVEGVAKQPAIKSMPEPILLALREVLRRSAVHELGVSDREARVFADDLSQGSLVIAFLLAQLDVHLEVDQATNAAIRLFRAKDPLLGNVANRLEQVENLLAVQAQMTTKTRQDLTNLGSTSAVLEQLLAYVAADRTENFLRGMHDITAAPFDDKVVIATRDRARDLTEKQRRYERERDGRPFR